MCFIKDWLQVIEKMGRHKKKGRVHWRRALNQQSLATAIAGTSL
jgi:hypothetical protein